MSYYANFDLTTDNHNGSTSDPFSFTDVLTSGLVGDYRAKGLVDYTGAIAFANGVNIYPWDVAPWRIRGDGNITCPNSNLEGGVLEFIGGVLRAQQGVYSSVYMSGYRVYTGDNGIIIFSGCSFNLFGEINEITNDTLIYDSSIVMGTIYTNGTINIKNCVTNKAKADILNWIDLGQCQYSWNPPELPKWNADWDKFNWKTLSQGIEINNIGCGSGLWRTERLGVGAFNFLPDNALYGYNSVPVKLSYGRDYKTNTVLGLEYFELENGNLSSIDWGSGCDSYSTNLSLYGNETYVNNVTTQLQANRDSKLLYFINLTDNIFGENIDHSNIMSGILTSITPRETTSWKGFKLDTEFKLINPVFKSLPEYNWSSGCIGFEHTSDTPEAFNVYNTINQIDYVYDHEADAGLCKFKFNMSDYECAVLREFYRNNRGKTFVLPSNFSITYPFGVTSGLGPHNIKILSMSEEVISPTRHSIEIVLTKVI